jgi:predicted Zn-dependent protease
MKKGILLDAYKLIILFGALWAIFTYVPWFHVNKDALTVSVETEEKIGRVLTKEVMAGQDEVKKPALDTALAVITNRLVASVGPTDFNYHFRVIDNPQINAFTLPGGNIFIYSGLIKFTHSPEELAAVIAHEIGHTEKRHVMNKLITEFGLTALFSIITGSNSTVLTKITHSITSSAFDRQKEAEADDYAFHLLDKAGIDPMAFADLFRRINDEQGTNSLDFEILRTHPDNNSRIKAALAYKTSPSFKVYHFKLDWDRVKESLGGAKDTI